MSCRQLTFKVISIHGNAAKVAPWPPSPDVLPFERTLSVSDLRLLEKNRGKTGALNFFNDYLRAYTAQYQSRMQLEGRSSLAAQKRMNWLLHGTLADTSTDGDDNLSSSMFQTFVGIVDARHMIVMPDAFWNDSLPYFSRLEDTNLPAKSFGSTSAHPICITVQYPQFFSNVLEDDYLDNSNSTYYNLWQTLRNGAKCITSSGTNAVW
jgi:hypothetical protein